MKTSSKSEDIITKADKGGAFIVIVDVDDCLKEVNQQLDNTKCYRKLLNNTTELNRTKVNSSIEKLKTLGLLYEKTANNLKSSEAKTQQFKMLPKIQKIGIPCKPVGSSVDCSSTKISKYIDQV